MGNICWCPDWWVEQQIYNLNDLIKNIEKLRNSKDKKIQINLNKYHECQLKQDKDGELLHKQLVCSLLQEKRRLSKVIIMLSQKRGKLEHTSVSMKTTAEIESTKLIIEQCQEYIQQGNITKDQVENILEILKEDEDELGAPDELPFDDNLEEFDTLIANDSFKRMPTVPTSMTDTRQLVYESI
jgi:hypothetical protein